MWVPAEVPRFGGAKSCTPDPACALINLVEAVSAVGGKRVGELLH
jgi:hypothetical protein